ncbi:hypothetical protein Zmor_016420 [Zophobas morio]|uniref:Serine/threonine-protein phosphatase PGAM5, mitochondrial n=1 Tax=Zophobas morio TaxID=2755281 RepID=A0AA38HJT9_9CUCU|nr:hypothetical protein Zmor_016420 [Zophobas morio]
MVPARNKLSLGLALSIGASVAGALVLFLGHSYFSKWDYNWDKKNEHYEKSKLKGHRINKNVTRSIYLVRHGQYYQDRKDLKLSEKGIQQAKLTGQALRRLPFHFDRVYCSSLTRAKETCNIILKELCYFDERDVNYSDLFCEGFPVEPEPSPSAMLCDQSEYFVEGARLEAAFRRLFRRPSPDQQETVNELLVAHGNVIRFMVCRALQLPPEMWLRLAISNCAVTRIDIAKSGRVTLRFLGEIGHLDHQLHSYN